MTNEIDIYKADEINEVADKYKDFYKLVIDCMNGKLSKKDVAKQIGVTERTVFEKVKRYKEEGIKAFKIAKRKRRETIISQKGDYIANLYLEKYNLTPFKTFLEILQNDYNIFLSYTSLKKVLKSKGIKNPDSHMHIRVKYNSVKDIECIINLLRPYMENDKTYSSMEEFGCIASCEALYTSVWRSMKKQILTTKKESLNTALKTLQRAQELGYIKDIAPWNYWSENHKYFSTVYQDEALRKKVMFEIRELYFPMLFQAYFEMKSRLETSY